MLVVLSRQCGGGRKGLAGEERGGGGGGVTAMGQKGARVALVTRLPVQL